MQQIPIIVVKNLKKNKQNDVEKLDTWFKNRDLESVAKHLNISSIDEFFTLNEDKLEQKGISKEMAFIIMVQIKAEPGYLVYNMWKRNVDLDLGYLLEWDYEWIETHIRIPKNDMMELRNEAIHKQEEDIKKRG